jgi:hypothetical protein
MNKDIIDSTRFYIWEMKQFIFLVLSALLQMKKADLNGIVFSVHNFNQVLSLNQFTFVLEAENLSV